MKFREALLSGMVALTLNSAHFATAQDANGQTYEPDYFAQYSPRTALDMVGRIPGFQLRRSNDKRGLGQGGANVLINGERISGKTDVVEQLGRITAPNVVRIEIKDGARLDIPGLSGQVANIITKNTGVTGTWEWSPEFRPEREPNWFSSKLTVSGEKDKLAYSLTLQNNARRNGHAGPETHFTPDGTIFEIREEDGQYYSENPGISVDLTWKPKDEHVANLDLEYFTLNFNARETSQRTALTSRGTTQETLSSSAEDEWNASASGDYELPAGPESLGGKLKLIGYYRFEHSPIVSRFDVFDPNVGQTSGSRFFRIADETEAIGRTEYSWTDKKKRDWQFGIEGAFNILDIASNLLVRDDTGIFVDVPIDGASSRVEELRTEATLTHSRELSSKWDLQLSAGLEYSEISQTGGLVRDFVRPKGFITTTYKPNDTLSIRTKIEREVGQLDFFDFISSVSLEDDFDFTGNINLVPEQSWFGELEFDKKFGQGSTFNVRFYGELISDLVDRIPIGVDGDAIGNIDSAHRYGVDLAATVKGDKCGYKGTELKLYLDLRKSSVEDPLLGFNRRLDRDKVSYWGIDFRHDIPDTDWAWGFDIEEFINARSYRLSTINLFTFEGPWSSAFIEHKDIFGLKVRASLRNLFDASDDFKREIFTDRRDLGVLDFTESNSRDFGRFVRFEVSGAF